MQLGTEKRWDHSSQEIRLTWALSTSKFLIALHIAQGSPTGQSLSGHMQKDKRENLPSESQHLKCKNKLGRLCSRQTDKQTGG